MIINALYPTSPKNNIIKHATVMLKSALLFTKDNNIYCLITLQKPKTNKIISHNILFLLFIYLFQK